MKDCIFCKISNREAQAEIIWENPDFMAFLDLFPIVPGATVVIPKKHHDSYIKNADKTLTNDFMEAIKTVMEILDAKLEGNMRTKLVFEGLEVSHLHAKLWPMYKGGKEITPKGPASEEELKKIALKLQTH